MKKFIFVALLVATPFVASAQLGNVQNLMQAISNIVNMALPIVAALALLAFFWGLMKFIFASGDEDKREDGKRIMIWGIIALFVMVSVWGLVRFIGQALDIDQGGTINLPSVPMP